MHFQGSFCCAERHDSEQEWQLGGQRAAGVDLQARMLVRALGGDVGVRGAGRLEGRRGSNGSAGGGAGGAVRETDPQACSLAKAVRRLHTGKFV